MTDGKRLAELSGKYFSGTITREEEKALYSLVRSNPEYEATFRLLERSWHKQEGHSLLTEMSLARLEKRISTQKHIARYRRTSWILAAAVCLLMATVGFLTVRTARESSYIVEAPHGGRSRTMLPDGTEVWLNACSRLTVPNDFPDSKRIVRLEGEGYFNVAKNGKRLFVVEAGETKTVVRGTKFNLSAYPEARSVRLSVEEGLVSFICGGDEREVSKMQSLEYDRPSGRAWVKGQDSGSDSSWLEGRMEYEDITLEELLERISRKYSVSVAFGSSLHKEDRFSASFRNNESVGEIVQSLKLILQDDISFNGEEIHIK